MDGGFLKEILEGVLVSLLFPWQIPGQKSTHGRNGLLVYDPSSNLKEVRAETWRAVCLLVHTALPFTKELISQSNKCGRSRVVCSEQAGRQASVQPAFLSNSGWSAAGIGPPHGLDPPRAVTNQDSPPQTCSQAHLIKASLQWRCSHRIILGCINWQLKLARAESMLRERGWGCSISKDDINSWPSCLYLSTVRVTDMCHHEQFMLCWGNATQGFLHARWGPPTAVQMVFDKCFCFCVPLACILSPARTSHVFQLNSFCIPVNCFEIWSMWSDLLCLRVFDWEAQRGREGLETRNTLQRCSFQLGLILKLSRTF